MEQYRSTWDMRRVARVSAYSEEDMIVAPATPGNVRAPLAVLRLSGGECINHLNKWFQPHHRRGAQPWRARYGNWLDEQGVIDDVMVITYRAPKSYTGQDMIEVFCHGNPMFIEAIIATVLAAGGRRARPGEFTMRAVLNGKMDLLSAEAVHGLIESHTRYQANLIRRQQEGPLVEFIKEQVEQILQIQAHIEATIDYGEEDVDALERDVLATRLEVVLKELNQVHRTASFVKGMQRGFKVLLIGEPNVGKSTLFNTLVRQERAIVTELPGTTRDVISESIEIAGLPIQLMDSAGMRESQDRIEVLGIEKIRSLIHEVDLVLCLYAKDGSLQPLPILKEIPERKRLEVITKADLPGSAEYQGLAVSAKDDLGIKGLEQEIVIRLSTALEGQQVYLINQRQEETLFAVIEDLQRAYVDYQAGHGEEVLSAYLNAARRRLGELTGETTVEDILDRMFSNFCLGK